MHARCCEVNKKSSFSNSLRLGSFVFPQKLSTQIHTSFHMAYYGRSFREVKVLEPEFLWINNILESNIDHVQQPFV